MLDFEKMQHSNQSFEFVLEFPNAGGIDFANEYALINWP